VEEGDRKEGRRKKKRADKKSTPQKTGKKKGGKDGPSALNRPRRLKGKKGQPQAMGHKGLWTKKRDRKKHTEGEKESGQKELGGKRGPTEAS